MEAEGRRKVLARVELEIADGKPKGALELLRPYLKLYSADARANALAGIAYAADGNLVQAVRNWKLSLAVDGNQNEIARMLVSALVDLKRWEEVLPIAEELHRRLPNDKTLEIELESIRENAGVPDIGWKRDAFRADLDVRYGGE